MVIDDELTLNRRHAEKRHLQESPDCSVIRRLDFSVMWLNWHRLLSRVGPDHARLAGPRNSSVGVIDSCLEVRRMPLKVR
jgi:hypothetical protein